MNRRALIVTRFSVRSSFSNPRLRPLYFKRILTLRARCLKNKYDLFVQGDPKESERNRRKSRIARKRHVDTLNNRSASPILLLLLHLPFSITIAFQLYSRDNRSNQAENRRIEPGRIKRRSSNINVYYHVQRWEEMVIRG